MKNRHVNSPFWTPERDARLHKLEAAGVPLKKIAAALDVTPSAVQRRSYRLRGITLPSQTHQLLSEIAARQRKAKDRRTQIVLGRMREAIRRGVPRNKAILQAVEQGAGFQKIADAVGVNRLTIYRIIVLQGAPERLLKSKAAERRKRVRKREAAALAALRAAIRKGVPREKAMVEARNEGVTYQLIGKAYGLTRQRVQQILLMQEL